MFFGVNDTQPGLYAPENREILDSDLFKGSEKSVSDSKKTLQNFDVEGGGGIIFLTQKKEGGNEKLRRERVKEVNGEKLYEELLEIKDRSAFRFFNKCFLVNQLISKYECFLKFFERREKYRFLINKKLM